MRPPARGQQPESPAAAEVCLTAHLSFSTQLFNRPVAPCYPALLLALGTTIATPSSLCAQSMSEAGRDASCLRYLFGTWTPALDWRGAGHTVSLDSAKLDRAPRGRSWAAPTGTPSGDTILMLYPPFWPAGVSLAFDPKRLYRATPRTSKQRRLSRMPVCHLQLRGHRCGGCRVVSLRCGRLVRRVRDHGAPEPATCPRPDRMVNVRQNTATETIALRRFVWL